MSSAEGGTAASATGPRAKCDQVIFEALSKATEIVVASRGGGGTNHNDSAFSGAAPQSSSSSSSRFNLTLPENPALRNILQRWRRALHLPIRLDVYFEHDDNKRELLERWCLGYVIGGDAFWRDPHNNSNTALLNQHADPIVQLRHVCKKIVIWLRTLYCYARMLPSTAFLNAKVQEQQQSVSLSPKVGFSLYAVSEDTDDVSQLKEQGFCHQTQPTASPLTTPYGELSWQVLYASRETVERLLPHISHQVSQTKAIPIAPQHHSHTNHFETRNQPHNNNISLPQTAPAHTTHFMNEGNQRGGVGGGILSNQNNNTTAQKPQQNTYNPSFFTGRDRQPQPQQSHPPLPVHGLLQRRHTSIGQESEKNTNDNDNIGVIPPAIPGQEKPQRVLSGLSLALMNDNGNNHSNSERKLDAGPPETTPNPDTAAAEKRRAALHQMPPHLQQQQQQQPLTSYGFGYAYNNHIPWQKLQQPDPPVTSLAVARDPPPGSPLLGTTPPSGVFLAAGTSAERSPGVPVFGSLLPPARNRDRPAADGAVTPPFATRPTGFVQDFQQQQARDGSPSSAAHPAQASRYSTTTPSSKQANSPQQQELDMPQLTSLDMLHHSPFLAGPHHHPSHGGSLLSSLSGVGGAGAGVLGSGSDLMRQSAFAASFSPAAEDDYEEMPFAVDCHSPPATDHTTQTAASHLLASSAAVTSFAQKCSMHQRLELFDQQRQEQQQQQTTTTITASNHNSNNDDELNQLTEQLADFRSFGASLRLSGTAAAGGPDAAAAVASGATHSATVPLQVRP